MLRLVPPHCISHRATTCSTLSLHREYQWVNMAFLFHFVVKGRACSLIIFMHYLNTLQASARGMNCTTQSTALFFSNRGCDHKQAQYQKLVLLRCSVVSLEISTLWYQHSLMMMMGHMMVEVFSKYDGAAKMVWAFIVLSITTITANAHRHYRCSFCETKYRSYMLATM